MRRQHVDVACALELLIGQLRQIEEWEKLEAERQHAEYPRWLYHQGD